MTVSEGWFLYGRVGAIADCRGGVPAATRRLCVGRADRRPESPSYYVWNESSPARRVFGDEMTDRSNALLRDFAVATIEHHPGPYARLVESDFLRFFRPDGGGIGSIDPLVLPTRHSPEWHSGYAEETRKAYFPSYKGRQIHWPAAALRDYRDWLHTQRWLMAAFAIAALGVLLGGIARPLRRLLPRRREVFLLGGTALALLLGPVATVEFWLRFLIPAVPLLVCGGAIALEDIVAAIRNARVPVLRPAGTSRA
jgi:hypothetical protein